MTPEPYLMLEDRTDPNNAEFAEFAEGVPTPLAREVDTPDFPFYALPKPIGAFVHALAESTQTAPGLAGGAALAALSAAAGGFYQVQVRPGYSEPVHLFIAVIAGSGERKSSVMKAATAPVREVERDLYQELAPGLLEQATQRDIAERYAEKAKRDAGNASDPVKRDELMSAAISAAGQAEAMKILAPPRIIGDDVTVEALDSLMAEQGGRFAILSSEGGLFTELSGRYSPNTDITNVLMAHAGDPIRVDRKGRPSEFVEDPALTVGIMIQPPILAEALNNRAFVGSGLMARFMYSWPPSMVGRRSVDPEPVSEHIAQGYRDALYSLAHDARKAGVTTTLTLSPEADKARLVYAEEVEQELAPGGSLAHMQAWSSKVVGAAVRMAGLFHAATEKNSTTISGNTMDAGIILAKYFTAHATRVFDGLSEGAATHALARRVVSLIRRKELDWFALRDLIGAAPTWLPTREVAQPVVELLVDLGYLYEVVPERKPGPGRPPAKKYRVHHSVFDADPPQRIKRIKQNPNIADSAELAEPPTTPYGDEPRCPIHRTLIGPTGKCIECVHERAAANIGNRDDTAA